VLDVPDGTVDALGRRHWNAGPACCDFDGVGTDHVGLLRRRMDGRPTVVVGFSNGSFMAQRLACVAPEVIAVVSLAGGDPLHTEPCLARGPVAVVHVHGSDDRVVPLRGGHVLGDRTRPSIPPAEDVLLRWGERNGCDASRGFVERTRLDLSSSLPGSETSVRALTGCDAPVELWVMEAAGHVDVASPAVVRSALETVL
jgi:polyhydroxybutyrate depolymerase